VPGESSLGLGQYRQWQRYPILDTMPVDTDTESDVIGVFYSSVNSAPKPVCPSSNSLVFVMRASQHEAGGLWSMYNQRQWKPFFVAAASHHADRALI